MVLTTRICERSYKLLFGEMSLILTTFSLDFYIDTVRRNLMLCFKLLVNKLCVNTCWLYEFKYLSVLDRQELRIHATVANAGSLYIQLQMALISC